MKKNIIFCFTIVLLSVISCTDRFSLQDKEEYIDLFVTASLDTNETRTSLYEVSGTDSAYVQWSDNDTITLYCGQSKWSSSTATNITNNGRSAQFSFKVLSGEARTILTQGTSYIYYGKQSVSVDANGVPQSITLNATQVSDGTAAFNDGDNASFAVVSNDKFTVKYKDDNRTTIDNISTACTMNNVFSILKINVALQDSGKKLQSVNVTDKDSANVCLAGKFNITFTDGKPVVSFATGSTGTDAVSSLEKKISSDISSGVFYYLIPPGTLSTGFKVSVFTKDGYYGGKTITFKDGKQNPMVRSRIIEVSLNKFQPQNPIPTPRDTATANCYIVPAEAGTYSIPADYMGNGYQGNKTAYVPAGSNKIDGAVSAELIWQSKLNADVLVGGDIISNVCFFERPVNDTTKKHYIGFNRTGVPGNALVAVKDASGTILWSWHLWITNDVSEADLNDDHKIMDRNLGALSKTEAPMNHGCAYQFGRKDPFLGSRYCKISPAWSTNNANTFAKLYPSNAVSCYQSYEAGGVKFTLAESIKHPNVRSMYPTPLWCDELNDGVSWTYSGTKAKTLYDPCPAGWRVITAEALDFLGDALNVGEGIVSDQGNSYSYNNIIFPTSGRSIAANGVEKVGTHVFLWYPTMAIYQTIRFNTALQIDVETNSVSKAPVGTESTATLSVRCEKYTEPALPTGK